jgi:hypothetical protein
MAFFIATEPRPMPIPPLAPVFLGQVNGDIDGLGLKKKGKNGVVHTGANEKI